MSKKKKGARGGLSGVFDAYNAKQTGGTNYGNTALKSIVDVALGVPIGIAIGGAAGLWSLPFGALLIGAGHHFKDQSGLLRITGAAAIAYGVAKNIDFNAAAKAAKENGVGGLAGATQGIKDRLKTVKDELLTAYFLDKLFKKGDSATAPKETKSAEIDEPVTIGSLDLSELDLFESFNEQEADEFEAREQERAFLGYEDGEPEELPDFTVGYPDGLTEDAAYSLYGEDDEPVDY